MKKLKIIIGIMMITIFIFFGSSTSSINASSEDAVRSTNSRLLGENIELKKEYSKLLKKLEQIKITTEEIYNQNNILYSQILGVDFDTMEFDNYRNDSIDIIFRIHNSIFEKVNDRALYASEMLALELERLQATSYRFKNNKNAILYYPTITPIKTSEFICVSSPYGWRNHPIKKKVLFHDGIDISADVGAEVFSTAQGRVVMIMYSKYGYGNRILIKHAYGFETLYAHLGIIDVKKGQWVRKNQLIGVVGNTGGSTGPHLHYEIHKNGETRDPLGYFYTHITNELLASN